MMNWPGIIDYCDALQQPRLAFRNSRLKVGAARLADGAIDANVLGLPLLHSGDFAAVCKVNLPRKAVAVRLFLFPDPQRAARYATLQKHLATLTSSALLRFVYEPEGFTIRAESYPLIAMPWVAGEQLTTWVGGRLREKDF